MPTYCEPCGLNRLPVEAVREVEGVPMCAPCSVQAQQELERLGLSASVRELVRPSNPRAVELCSRGCGKAPHRGLCAGLKERMAAKGEIPQPAPERNYAYSNGPRQAKAEIPQPAPMVTITHQGILLPPVVVEARSASAPCNGAFRVVKRADLPGVRRRVSANLNRRVFDAMLAARPEAVEVPVEGWKAGVNLRRRLQLMARPKGLEIDWSRTEDFKTFYFWLVDGAA